MEHTSGHARRRLVAQQTLNIKVFLSDCVSLSRIDPPKADLLHSYRGLVGGCALCMNYTPSSYNQPEGRDKMPRSLHLWPQTISGEL